MSNVSSVKELLFVGKLSVVSFQEEGHWVAQCLEYDIVAQSKTLAKLPRAFALAFASHVFARINNRQDPFAKLSRAPSEYWKLFEQGLGLDERVARVPVSAEESTEYNAPPMPPIDMRVCA
ncbi:MAG: hypothetical protein OXB87_04405 [Hyphomicrobiales bacterium]|nr:hypothetical protein [Hyphomicrobiales bacterium]